MKGPVNTKIYTDMFKFFTYPLRTPLVETGPIEKLNRMQLYYALCSSYAVINYSSNNYNAAVNIQWCACATIVCGIWSSLQPERTFILNTHYYLAAYGNTLRTPLFVRINWSSSTWIFPLNFDLALCGWTNGYYAVNCSRGMCNNKTDSPFVWLLELFILRIPINKQNICESL